MLESSVPMNFYSSRKRNGRKGGQVQKPEIELTAAETSSVCYLYQAVQSLVFCKVLQPERISPRNAASPLQLLSSTHSDTVKANLCKFAQ